MKNIEQKIASLRIGKHHIVKKNRHRPPLPAKPFSLRIFPTTKDYLGDISVLSTYWKRGSHFCFGDRPNPFLLECAQIFQRQKSLKIILSLQPESSLLFIFYINKNQLGQERRNVFVFNLELKISKWNISQIHAMWGVLCQKYNSSWTFWKDISWLEFILTKWVGVLCNLS